MKLTLEDKENQDGTFHLHRESCEHYSRTTIADSSDGYFGQGDYHVFTKCGLNKTKLIPLPSNWEPGQKGCPRDCEFYQPSPQKNKGRENENK